MGSAYSQVDPEPIGWLQQGRLPVTGFTEGSRESALTFPGAVSILGISPVIGLKTLNQLAGGILRARGGGTVKTVSTVSFPFGCIF